MPSSKVNAFIGFLVYRFCKVFALVGLEVKHFEVFSDFSIF
jgi:hypothetical protein